MNEDKRKLKNISKHKWTNPNSFSATTAVLAFLTIIVVFALIQFVLSPLLSNLVQGSIGYGASLCISALISQAIILFVAWIFCKICHVKMFGGGISLKFDFKICIPALTLSLGTLLFIAPLHTKFSNGISYFQEWFTTSNSLSDITSNLSIADMVWLVVYALVIAPFLPAFCEEALFRGVIMNGLKEFGIFFATMASGLIFALMHGNYSQLILQFLLGCEIAFVVLITKNYFAGIVMHFANNSLGTIIIASLVLAEEGVPVFGGLINSLSILFGLILICVAIIYYYKLCRYKKKIEDGTLEWWSSFAFYSNLKQHNPCCLLEKGADIDSCFSVDAERVLKTDNKGFLFFGGKRFHKFARPSNKTVFNVLFITGIVFSVILIILDFFLVG